MTTLEIVSYVLILVSAVFKGIALMNLNNKNREFEISKKKYTRFNIVSYLLLCTMTSVFDGNPELIQQITFAEGETEKTALVRTKRNTNTTGDQYFTVELSSDDEALILGFHTAARITILDTETHGSGPYTESSRFAFPAAGKAILEMDLLELHNDPSDDGGWPLQITEKDWASGGRFLNCLNGQDEVHLYYTAGEGAYSCTMYYRSGDPRNSIEWYDDEGRIQSGTASAGAGDSAGATHEAHFTITVLEGGDGLLKFSGGEFKGPQIDYIEITRAG